MPLNKNQIDALCSFVWNLGPGSMSWDVGRLLRARNYEGAANAMLAYDRAGGQVLPGLVRRRQAERALFLTPVQKPKPAPVKPVTTPGGQAKASLSLNLRDGGWTVEGVPGSARWGKDEKLASVLVQLNTKTGQWTTQPLPFNYKPHAG